MLCKSTLALIHDWPLCTWRHCPAIVVRLVGAGPRQWHHIDVQHSCAQPRLKDRWRNYTATAMAGIQSKLTLAADRPVDNMSVYC